MRESTSERYIVGPDGQRMTAADLPATDTKRWVPMVKARIVAAVRGGLISREEALERYRVSDEEFDGWQSALSTSGVRGLRVTRIRASTASQPNEVIAFGGQPRGPLKTLPAEEMRPGSEERSDELRMPK